MHLASVHRQERAGETLVAQRELVPLGDLLPDQRVDREEATPHEEVPRVHRVDAPAGDGGEAVKAAPRLETDFRNSPSLCNGPSTGSVWMYEVISRVSHGCSPPYSGGATSTGIPSKFGL